MLKELCKVIKDLYIFRVDYYRKRNIIDISLRFPESSTGCLDREYNSTISYI